MKAKTGKIKIHVNKLGRSIYIPEDTMIIENGEGFTIKYFDCTYSIIIGIGNDCTAEFIINKDALNALRNGEVINVEKL